MSGVETRLSQRRKHGGGAKQNAGRPAKEKRHPNTTAALTQLYNQRRTAVTEQRRLLAVAAERRNPRGRSWSFEESRLLICIVVGFMIQQSWTQTQALHNVATASGRSYSALHHLFSAWLADGVIVCIDSSSRGGGAYTHLNNTSHIPTDIVGAIHTYIMTMNNGGVGCSIPEIASHLQQEYQTAVEQPTIRSLLHRMGYRYDYAPIIGQINDDYRRARINVFIKQYSRALQLQAAGSHVIVYTDESYVHTAQRRRMTWFNPNHRTGNCLVRKMTKGKRLVLLHAMTQYGMVQLDPLYSSNADDRILTAELIYEAVKDKGDYHDNMNGHVYMSWLINRLLPTCATMFPDKHVILVLDNARYHHVRDDDYINPNAYNKKDIAQVMIRLGITNVTVSRTCATTLSQTNITFDSATFDRRGGRSAPRLDELKEKLRQFLVDHPEHQQTAVQKLFRNNNHMLIYTPPYTPNVQPIESAWAYVKRYVATQYSSGRTVSQLIEQTRRGFYGDGRLHAALDGGKCAKLIHHSHDWCNNWIESETDMIGTIDNLQTTPSQDNIDLCRDEEEEYNDFDDDDDEGEYENDCDE